MHFFYPLSISLSLCFFLTCSADDLSNKAKMRQGLDIICDTLETQYAPLEWKAEYLGFNLYQSLEDSKAEVNRTPNITTKQFQYIVKNFLNLLRDYHVNISFYSSEGSYIPLKLKSVNERFFISYIEYEDLPTNAKTLFVGDEVISINDCPVQQVIQHYYDTEYNGAQSLSDRSIANYFFFKRLGSQGQLIPLGDLKLEVKHSRSGVKESYLLEWEHYPEQINNIDLKFPKTFANAYLGSRDEPSSILFPLNRNEIFQKKMMTPLLTTMGGGEGLGERQSFLPPLGKKLWESPSTSAFHAYLFETTEKQVIGYVRIPHFNGSSEHILEFENIIKRFSRQTDALIIDQLNNPGGSVFYMYCLASLLTEKPLDVPPHKISMTQKEIAFAVEALSYLEYVESDEQAKEIFGDDLHGYPLTKEVSDQITLYFRAMIEDWNSGKTISRPLTIWGINHVSPHAFIRYTQPILVLINELDFSCGDFFPAMLQDNHRATLFGTRTAGAGGFVLGTKYPNLLGIESFSYTGSIAERSNANPIENLGVTPDISYDVTTNDLINKYQDYVKSVHESLKNLLK